MPAHGLRGVGYGVKLESLRDKTFCIQDRDIFRMREGNSRELERNWKTRSVKDRNTE